ncbi:hypothetical protein Goari_005547, partial [Gossypium aridum]|nr:hypothetical protein [Gossypium aridum]
MRVEERAREGLSDARNCYWYGSIVNFEGWKRGDNYKKRVREISNAWNQTRRMKIRTVSPLTTPEYIWWWERRINDNIPVSSQEDVRPIEEHLQ